MLFISDRQVREILGHIDDLPLIKVSAEELRRGKIPLADKGIYSFLRSYSPRVRAYLGASTDMRLTERVHEQLHKRRWAEKLLMFDLTSLEPQILFALESRLLVLASLRLQHILWDNERGLFTQVSASDAQRELPEPLEHLAAMILAKIEKNVRSRHRAVQVPMMQQTHQLGSPDGQIYGLANVSGGRTHLLIGSRINSAVPNIRAVRKDPTPPNLLLREYHYGLIAWKPGCQSRPPGLMVTEPIPFRCKELAREFLTAGRERPEQWVLL